MSTRLAFVSILVLFIFPNIRISFGLKRSTYAGFGCDGGLIAGFDEIKPLRFVRTEGVRSRLECLNACAANTPNTHTLVALVYKNVDNMTLWTCHMLTTYVTTFDVYDLGPGLTNVAVTPFCNLYFKQGQTCDDFQGQDQSMTLINVWPDHPGVPAMCDFVSGGGGWTVIQRRQDGALDFYRGWEEYKAGFGSLSGEFWYGLEKIRAIVISRPTEIRFDVETAAGVKRYAVYQNFWLNDEANLYRMTVGSYSGNAGDSFTFHNNSSFDTKDKLPRAATHKCPERYSTAFWFKNCHNINPNGMYGSTEYGHGVNWNLLTGYFESLVFIEMKLRPMA